jgi:hypothetical protein
VETPPSLYRRQPKIDPEDIRNRKSLIRVGGRTTGAGFWSVGSG